jgi:hypothetical protein
VTGVDLLCDVGEVARVGGGVTATSTREQAVARYVKPAGATTFAEAPVTAPPEPRVPPSSEANGGGGGSW